RPLGHPPPGRQPVYRPVPGRRGALSPRTGPSDRGGHARRRFPPTVRAFAISGKGGRPARGSCRFAGALTTPGSKRLPFRVVHRLNIHPGADHPDRTILKTAVREGPVVVTGGNHADRSSG